MHTVSLHPVASEGDSYLAAAEADETSEVFEAWVFFVEMIDLSTARFKLVELAWLEG